MTIASRILAVLLVAACAGSAIADLRRNPRVLATLERLKVPAPRLPVLAAMKMAAVLGLVAGFAQSRLAVVTGLCLATYFAIAVSAHSRAKDSIANTLPAFTLLAVSVLYLLTTIGS